ncbi:hypothetical protein M404DRAFT_186743 [Pisolithus tinctorius Marx 270]|uniref:Uncharacterized protein n=1 Tax=Pisolithus tinctorius Marx 270 TaxID=870435 RepID=A0A0C3PKJ4_PISTI|nr:hypothetical protein M404DRAFT_186743 [Pisolithus tinctorius Marx 270]
MLSDHLATERTKLTSPSSMFVNHHSPLNSFWRCNHTSQLMLVCQPSQERQSLAESSSYTILSALSPLSISCLMISLRICTYRSIPSRSSNSLCTIFCSPDGVLVLFFRPFKAHSNQGGEVTLWQLSIRYLDHLGP